MTGSDTRSGRSLRHNFTSVLFGNSVYRLSQWILVAILARWSGVDAVASFALAQAIAAPVFLFVGLNLRVARATDVQGIWSPRQYHRLRLYLNAASIALSGLIAWMIAPSQNFTLVALALALSKASETSSQLSYGYFQLRERLDLMSRSLLLRALTGTAPFALTVIQTGSLLLGCLALTLGWMVVTFAHDRPLERRLLSADSSGSAGGPRNGTLLSLAQAALPLGFTAGVTSLTQNVPRYIIQVALGHTALGLFAALDYLRQIITMITSSLGDSLIARLARSAQSGRYREYLANMLLLGGFAVLISLLVLGLGAAFGQQLTELTLSSEYVNQPVLLTLLAGGGVVSLQTVLVKGLQAGRRFREIAIVNVATGVATVAFGALAIPTWGLVGAASTLGVGYFVGCLVAVCYLRHMTASMGARREPVK